MPTYARFHEKTVIEIFVVPENQTIGDYFHADVPFELVENGTRVGFFIDETGVLTNPTPPEPPAPLPPPVAPEEPLSPPPPLPPGV